MPESCLKRGWAAGLAFCAAAAAFAISTGAAGADEVRYPIGARVRKFYRSDSDRILISASCVSPTKSFHCQAYDSLRKASLKSLVLKPGEGPNPGPFLCRELRGDVVFSRDASLNETAFCRFADGSMVSTSSLAYYAASNDGRRK